MTKHRPQVAQTLGEFVIRPQVPFFDKNRKKKTHLVFLFCYLLLVSLLQEPFGTSIKRLPNDS